MMIRYTFYNLFYDVFSDPEVPGRLARSMSICLFEISYIAKNATLPIVSRYIAGKVPLYSLCKKLSSSVLRAINYLPPQFTVKLIFHTHPLMPPSRTNVAPTRKKLFGTALRSTCIVSLMSSKGL